MLSHLRDLDPAPDDAAVGPLVPLSAHAVWRHQRAYFEAEGPNAWATGTVPHQVTSNPDMARALAEVVIGFATDLSRRAHASAPRPLYIVELGAGAGRLGFHMVRALRAARDLAALGWRPIYVLTDVAEATVAWWQAHPWLAPLAQTGQLDFARFDALADDELVLRVSGRRISARQPLDAMVVVANYVFDSLPHDVFEVDSAGVREWRVADVDAPYRPGAPVDWAPRWELGDALPPSPRYADPIHQRVLDAYRPRRGTVVVPSGSLVALDRMRALRRGPMLVLSADKGVTTIDDAVADELPAVIQHGSVSMSVNYHAIGAWALAHGGTWMHADHHGRSLEVCGLVLGAGRAADHPATVATFERAIARRGPDDLHALKRMLVAHAAELTLPELLAYLRQTGHDPHVFVGCARAIRRAALEAEPSERADLVRALGRVWDAYLPIGEERDVAFEIARMFATLGRPAQALPILEASRALHGERPAVRTLIDRCRAAAGVDGTIHALW